MKVLVNNKPLQDLAQDSFAIFEIDKLMERAIGYVQGSDRFSTSIVCQASLKHLRAGGGRLRAQLSYDVSHHLGLDGNCAVAIGAAVELLHNASLVHDDIQDRSLSRRGKPNVRAVYGDDLAILVGDAMISGAYGVIAEYSSPIKIPQILRHTHNRVREVINGQCSDIQSHRRCRTVSEYTSIAASKSGGLIRLAMELPFIATDQNDETVDLAGRAAANYSVAYQIFDDLLDIQEDSKNEFKEQSLNLIHLLTSLMPHSEAIREAVRIARKLLENVILDCEVLPRSSGLPLINIARQLEAKIKGEFGQ